MIDRWSVEEEWNERIRRYFTHKREQNLDELREMDRKYGYSAHKREQSFPELDELRKMDLDELNKLKKNELRKLEEDGLGKYGQESSDSGDSSTKK